MFTHARSRAYTFPRTICLHFRLSNIGVASLAVEQLKLLLFQSIVCWLAQLNVLNDMKWPRNEMKLYSSCMLAVGELTSTHPAAALWAGQKQYSNEQFLRVGASGALNQITTKSPSGCGRLITIAVVLLVRKQQTRVRKVQGKHKVRRPVNVRQLKSSQIRSHLRLANFTRNLSAKRRPQWRLCLL